MLADRVRIGVVKERWGNYRNVAMEGVATASSVYNDYVASNAIDGNKTSTNSRWISDDTDPNPYWQVDLGQICKIDKILIYTDSLGGQYVIDNYRVEYWDGSNWVQFIDVTGSTNDLKTHEFTPIKTSKLKLSFPDRQGWHRIFEFEAYGETILSNDFISDNYITIIIAGSSDQYFNVTNSNINQDGNQYFVDVLFVGYPYFTLFRPSGSRIQLNEHYYIYDLQGNNYATEAEASTAVLGGAKLFVRIHDTTISNLLGTWIYYEY